MFWISAHVTVDFGCITIILGAEQMLLPEIRLGYI